jgi:hypothetical protein
MGWSSEVGVELGIGKCLGWSRSNGDSSSICVGVVQIGLELCLELGWSRVWDCAHALGGRDESERRRAESQWIVAARPLCHLQYPVTYLSRLQRILPVA